MKKLVFLFAMVLAISVAMAQTTANTAETEQDGNQNKVLVKQIGDLNEAESHQYGDENKASVVQTGDENIGIADQLNGNKNDASVLQDGNTNEGYIAQGMLEDFYGYTSSTMTAHRNNASLNQVGNGNLGDVVQVGNDNSTDIDQVGDNNDAYSYQGWAYGFWGETYATSHLSSYSSVVDISQLGNGNYGAVWQYGGNNNEANISQDGNTNTASVAQGFIYTDGAYDFTYPVYNTKDNFVSIDQLGDDNVGKVFQLGDGNSFKLNQTGVGNIVGYNPSASTLTEKRNAYFAQDGNNNRFAGLVLNTSNTPSFRAGLDAEQYNGATLSHESYQKGDYNDIGLRQGQDDLGLIQQDGIGNEALLWQQGADQNTATMLQFGNNNTAGVVQIQQ